MGLAAKLVPLLRLETKQEHYNHFTTIPRDNYCASPRHQNL
jgi:hypothetical protein